MNYKFELLRIARAHYIQYLEDYSLDQLNTVPVGFKNNLIWNAAHIVATTDLLVNKLNDLPLKFDSSFIQAYTKGSAPSVAVDQAFVDKLKLDLLHQIDWVEEDYQSGKFPESTVIPYTTSFGNVLTDISSILTTIPLHEGIHLGVMMSIKKLVGVKNS